MQLADDVEPVDAVDAKLGHVVHNSKPSASLYEPTTHSVQESDPPSYSRPIAQVQVALTVPPFKIVKDDGQVQSATSSEPDEDSEISGQAVQADKPIDDLYVLESHSAQLPDSES